MINFLVITRSPHVIKSVLWENSFYLCNDYWLYAENNPTIIAHKTATVYIIGDCINHEILTGIHDIGAEEIINNLKGNFYAILVKNNELCFISGAFSLLPIYYIFDYTIISSTVSLIREFSMLDLKENKKWIINQLLFNYQFSTDTIYKEIFLFPSLSYLRIKEKKCGFIKYYNIDKSYVQNPKKWRKSIRTLSKLFIEISESYIPENDSVISFTGGFDGRTLLSIAKYNNKDFQSFSYGKKGNADVNIPSQNSKLLDIPYFSIILDEKYSENYYLSSSIDFIKNTDGANGFLYAHVDYSARKVRERGSFLISGVCGSELFRAPHFAGAVFSKALLNLFTFDSLNKYKESVMTSNVFKFIDIKDFDVEIQEVIEESWNYKISFSESLSKNQKLYVFTIEEIFRKFFGPWIVSQNRHINVRTPFIDFEFFKELIESELFGAYNDFITQNPFKRFIGQLLYCDVIKNTNRLLYTQKTGKGYSPRTVREFYFRPLLLISLIAKKMKSNLVKENLDNLGIISGIKEYFKNNDIKNDLVFFDRLKLNKSIESLTPFTQEKERDILLTSISIINYMNLLK